MSSPRSRILQAALLSLSFVGIASLSAQSTWVGGTGNWSTDGNWSPATAPVSGVSTVLDFTHTGTAYTTTDDIAGDFQLNSLRFSGGSGGNISLARSTTQSLVFVADGSTGPTIVFDSSTSAAKTINVAMVLNADTTVTSSIANAAGNLQLGSMSGAGALIVDFSTSGSGTVLLAAASTWTGGLDLRAGRVVVGNTGSLGSGAVTLSGGVLRTTNGATALSFSNVLNFAGDTSFFEGANANPLTFTGGGSVQGSGATHTVTLGNAGSTLTLGGAFTGAGNGLTFAGSGTVNLGAGSSDTAANTYSGATTVSSSGVVLNLDKAAGTDAVAGDLVVAASRVNWRRGNQIADTAAVDVAGGTVDFAASSSGDGVDETVASLSLSAGTLATNPSGNASTGNTITVTGATTLTGGAFTVNRGSTLSTGSLAVTTAGSRNVGGTLEVGSGGLVINHDGTGSTRNAFTLYETATASAGVLVLGGDLTFNNNTGVTSKVWITRSAGTGYIDLAGGDRTFTINDGAAVDDFEITVRITNGGIIKEGDGVLSFLNTASDYAGDTVINAGTIRAGGSAQVFSNNSTYVLADAAGATLDLAGNSQSVGALAGGGSTGGTVALGAGTLTTGANNASTTYSGAITGTGGLIKTGTGTFTLSGDKAYTGATLVSDGALVVNGVLAGGPVTVDGAGASLTGSGAANGITVTAGSFGAGDGVGTFTSQGDVLFGAASTFAVEVAAAGSFDQLVVNGSSSVVTIEAGASLDLSGLAGLPALAEGTEFIFIANNGSSSITGTFLDWAEGQSVTLGVNTFVASYLLGGGVGNDFGFTVVSAVPEPSAAAVLAGLGALGFALSRNRRRR
ncbi:MAG: autotransporter-associated beta strand repeat-containing protein [Verrucomicrobiota bacterium]